MSRVALYKNCFHFFNDFFSLYLGLKQIFLFLVLLKFAHLVFEFFFFFIKEKFSEGGIPFFLHVLIFIFVVMNFMYFFFELSNMFLSMRTLGNRYI